MAGMADNAERVSSLETSNKMHSKDISKLFEITDSLSRPKYPLIIGVVTMLLVIVGGGGWLVNIVFTGIDKRHDMLYEKVFMHIIDGHGLASLTVLEDDMRRESNATRDALNDALVERMVGTEEEVMGLRESIKHLERK